jgi:serine/threonine protein phosphatase PrpC
MTDDYGYLVAVVSDGAGSTTSGGIAAKLICDELPRKVIESVCSLGDEACSDLRCMAHMRRALRASVGAVRQSLVSLAQQTRIPADELLATLVGVVAHPELGGLFFHIGDGAAIAFDDNGNDLALSPPENGEYVNTTYFLIEEQWKTHLRFRFFESGFKTIFLMTDGVTDLSFVRDGKGLTAFKPFFQPISSFLSSSDRQTGEAALADALNNEVARAKVDDDKTLVWAEAIAING